jgi:hypothetical protein
MKKFFTGMLITGLLIVALIGCNPPVVIDVTAPTVSSTNPANDATEVLIDAGITATFSEVMDSATITDLTFILEGTAPVAGVVTLNNAGTIATFTPAVDLALNTSYTATISIEAKDVAGNALASAYVWSFTTAIGPAEGPAAVDLGLAGNFVILAQTGITNASPSVIDGNIGVSPIAASAMTGFELVGDGSLGYTTSAYVSGNVYASDYAEPAPTDLTAAVAAMGAAYLDAQGRTSPDFTELSTGALGGLNLVPGLYNWTTAVSIATSVTLSGDMNDVWIFQIAGALTMAADTSVILSGGALPENIFWQVAGATTIAANAEFKGIILSATTIGLGAGANVDGRLLAQTNVTLGGDNTITEPAL